MMILTIQVIPSCTIIYIHVHAYIWLFPRWRPVQWLQVKKKFIRTCATEISMVQLFLSFYLSSVKRVTWTLQYVKQILLLICPKQISLHLIFKLFTLYSNISVVNRAKNINRKKPKSYRDTVYMYICVCVRARAGSHAVDASFNIKKKLYS